VFIHLLQPVESVHAFGIYFQGMLVVVMTEQRRWKACVVGVSGKRLAPLGRMYLVAETTAYWTIALLPQGYLFVCYSLVLLGE
jgi:hypothetical protein